jgi:hypothetical protein
VTGAGFSAVLFFQGPLVGVLLATAGIAKIIARPADITRTGFARLLSTHLRKPSPITIRVCWMGLAAVELCLAGWLLSGSQKAAAGAVGAVFGLLSLFYLRWVMRHERSASCGCLGTGTPVSWRTIARSCLLVLMMVGYTYGGVSTTTTYDNVTISFKITALLLAEAGIIALVSDELRVFRREVRLGLSNVVYSLRAMIASRDAPDWNPQESAWTKILARLESDGLTGEELVQSWRDGPWQLAEYRAWLGEAKVTVIGAEFLGMRPHWIRIFVVDESQTEPRILIAWDSAVAHDLEIQEIDIAPNPPTVPVDKAEKTRAELKLGG